jgi:hypothetical protein
MDLGVPAGFLDVKPVAMTCFKTGLVLEQHLMKGLYGP